MRTPEQWTDYLLKLVMLRSSRNTVTQLDVLIGRVQQDARKDVQQLLDSEVKAHAKTAKQFVDMKAYADHLEIKMKKGKTRR